ncbi:SpoIIE family protein phosphatase [candidate division KSB1 bacterium]|nr:SpoIIE family protein phosphatase [candidate division KSB1 bacterium]
MKTEQHPPSGAPGSDAAFQILQTENWRLKRAVEELSFLNDLARAIGASTNLYEIMQTIIRRSLQGVHAEQGVITLVGAQAGDPTKTLVRDMVTSSEHQPFRPNQSLLGWMYRNKTTLLLNDPGGDERFRGVNWDASVVSLLCAPLIVKSELKGILTVYNKKNAEGFSEEDQRFLAIIAAQSAQVIENARLCEEEQTLLRMQEQVRLAARIQLDLLPQTAPTLAGYDLAGRSIPAQSVGGDYFDFIPADGERLAVCLGDVSGKGLPASLLMANLQATIRGQTLLGDSASACLRRSNTLLFQSTDDEKFATVFYAILDPHWHQLRYCNAGHNDPFLFSATGAAPARLTTGGLVLGILPSFPFQEEAIALNPGDVLLIYSDGITEAVNAGNEDFGESRLITLVQQNLALPAGALIEKIIAAVTAFAGNVPQRDDITLVVVKRK